MTNPSIEDLHNPDKFEEFAALEHANIKSFVINQLAKGGNLVTAYMVYQILMMILGIWFVGRAIYLAFNHSFIPLIFTGVALVFSFTLLIPVHELLHGLALKLTGAKHIHYGAYLRKFIFYAEADRHVLGKPQFAFVALTPLFVIKAVSLLGIFIFFYTPILYFFIITMCTHSFFCAGDLALLTVFFEHNEVYTYDEKSEKKSYYFRKIA